MAELYCAVPAAQTFMGSSPKSPMLQVCGSKRLSCHADLYTVSRCHTRGESEDHTREKARKKRDPPWLSNPGQKKRLIVNSPVANETYLELVANKNATIIFAPIIQRDNDLVFGGSLESP